MNGYAQQPSVTLRRLRLSAGLSVRGLAACAGVWDGSIRRAEAGVVPKPATQVKIARALSLKLGRPVDTLELWPLIEEAA